VGSRGRSQRIGTGGTPPWRCWDFAIFSAGAKMKAILRRIAALYLLCASTSAFGGSFTVGYDEAWFADHYPNWLASNPSFYDTNLHQFVNVPSQFSATLSVMDKWFDGMAKGGAKIVRIWVFPGLQGIELNLSNSPGSQTVGLTLDSMREPEDSMRKPELIGNLKTVFKLAKHHGLMLQVVALNGVDMQAAVGTPLQAYFENLLLNIGGERDTFKTKVLLPLLKLLNENRNVVYGLDLINEIEATFISNPPYFANFPAAQDFIKDMAAFVKSNSSLRVTSSTGGAGGNLAVFEIVSGLFSGLGLDFYDVHFYADGGVLPSVVTGLCNKVSEDGVQIILGEYGQSLLNTSTDDILQSLTTANFLYTAKTTCFSAALAWMYEINKIPTQVYFLTYLRPNGTLRPAYNVIQSFGAH
jgi:hypothetical protein